MKTQNIKVIDYKKNGNDVKITIKPCFEQKEGEIYTFIDRYCDNMDCNYIKTVIAFNGFGLVVDCSADRNVLHKTSTNILKPDFLQLAINYRTNFFDAHEQAAKENKHIKNTVIELYKQLGRPYTHLIESKKNFQTERLKAENEKILKREAEAERMAKEQAERLKAEAERFKTGEKISGDDFIELCKINGVNLHPRTTRQVNDVVRKISHDTISFSYSGRKPSFGKIGIAQGKLFDILNDR